MVDTVIWRDTRTGHIRWNGQAAKDIPGDPHEEWDGHDWTFVEVRTERDGYLFLVSRQGDIDYDGVSDDSTNDPGAPRLPRETSDFRLHRNSSDADAVVFMVPVVDIVVGGGVDGDEEATEAERQWEVQAGR